MACLGSSVGFSHLPTIDIIVSMISRVMHVIIDIKHQFRFQQMISELMVFVQDSSALDEAEDAEWMEFDGGIKMKTKRKVRFVLKRRSDDQIIANDRRQDELDELTKASHMTSYGGSLRQQVKTAEGDEDDQWTRLIGRYRTIVVEFRRLRCRTPCFSTF